jgi:hypothetical protein
VSAVKFLATLEGVLSPGTMEKTRRGLSAAMRGSDATRCPPAARGEFLTKLEQ